VESTPTFIPVVAVVLLRDDGRVLMQRRSLASAHGGLWEFPGGKVEAGESPESALLREIEEELGIALDHMALSPLSFASDPALPPAPRAPHVILLYTCTRWEGEPHCHVGEEIGWFLPSEIPALSMPPLDYPLAHALFVKIVACQD